MEETDTGERSVKDRGMRRIIRKMSFWAVLLIAAIRHPATASPRYQLLQEVHESPTGHQSYTVLRMSDRRTHSTVWIRRTVGVNLVGWSNDHLAMALECGYGEKLLIWRAGYQPSTIDSMSDYVMDFTWSSDDRRLLVRSGGSGDDMADVGSLYCINVEKRHRYFVSDGMRGAKWIGRRRIQYLTTRYNPITHEMDSAERREWRSP